MRRKKKEDGALKKQTRRFSLTLLFAVIVFCFLLTAILLAVGLVALLIQFNVFEGVSEEIRVSNIVLVMSMTSLALDWYKWNAISSLNAYGTATDVQWYYNTRDLYIDAESLVEGVVYEVNVHIMLLPAPTYTATFNGVTKTCMQQASPCDTPTDPPNFNNG